MTRFVTNHLNMITKTKRPLLAPNAEKVGVGVHFSKAVACDVGERPDSR